MFLKWSLVTQVTLDLDHLILKASIMTRDSDRLFIDVPLSDHEAKKQVNKLFKELVGRAC